MRRNLRKPDPPKNKIRNRVVITATVAQVEFSLGFDVSPYFSAWLAGSNVTDSFAKPSNWKDIGRNSILTYSGPEFFGGEQIIFIDYYD